MKINKIFCHKAVVTISKNYCPNNNFAENDLSMQKMNKLPKFYVNLRSSVLT